MNNNPIHMNQIHIFSEDNTLVYVSRLVLVSGFWKTAMPDNVVQSEYDTSV